MRQIRRANDRGHGDHGWLDSRHTFSFAGYHDFRHMGFSRLRVMNEDRVAGGQGFGMHGHRDMEIFSYVLSGKLQHRDSLGNGAVLEPGEVQAITAGSGLQHSEFNPSPTEPVHFYQIWIEPAQRGTKPGYAQRKFDVGRAWTPIVSGDGRDGSLTIGQDAVVSLAKFEAGDAFGYEFAANRSGWVQLLRGTIQLDGETLHAGDGVALTDEQQLTGVADGSAEVMLFDLPPG